MSTAPSSNTTNKAAEVAKEAVRSVAKADQEVTHKAASVRDTPAMKVFAAFCEAADQPPLIIASTATLAVGLAMRRRDLARGGARMLASHLLATGAKLAIKNQVARTRHSAALEKGEQRFELCEDGDHDETSFPSGHTAGAVAVAIAASREIEGVAIPATLATVAVAAGQAPAGNHYLTDVVAGAAIGWAAEAIVAAVFDRVVPSVEALLSSVPLPHVGEGS